MELDLKRIFQVLWKHLIPLILAAIFCAAAAFLYSTLYITPKYTASTLLYISSDVSQNSGNVSGSQLSAARSLLDTYSVVVKSRPVMDLVLEKTNLNYSAGQLMGMISTSSVNDTEVLRVSVTCTDPAHAQILANAIATYGEAAIRNSIHAGSYSIIEEASLPTSKSSPNVSRNTAIGGFIGFFVPALIFVLVDFFDVRLRDVTELANTVNVPVLGTVVDYSELFDTKKGKQKK